MRQIFCIYQQHALDKSTIAEIQKYAIFQTNYLIFINYISKY